MTSFRDLGLNSALLQAIDDQNYETATPIQAKAIPLLLDGKDLLGLAQTGTGKTAAFGLPLIQHLFEEHERAGQRACRALILAPTRELAGQICQNLRDLSRRMHLRVALVVGGASIQTQSKRLNKGVDILVATPGRLLDLVKRRAVFLDQAKYLVLDEADLMLDLGFIHALREISKLVASPRQTMLFSATMSKLMQEVADSFLSKPQRIQMSHQGKAADKVTQSVHFVAQKQKTTLLKQLLSEQEPDDLSLVFTRTKQGAEKLMQHLRDQGYAAESIHGNKSQGQRDRAIRDFKSGACKILVATDVAARGIDVPGVARVYNYELPNLPESYVHRIGRTARAGAEGQAIAFCSPAEAEHLWQIERLMRITIEVAGGTPPVRERRSPKTGQRASGKPPRSGAGRRPAGKFKPKTDKPQRDSRADPWERGPSDRAPHHGESPRATEQKNKKKAHRKGKDWGEKSPRLDKKPSDRRGLDQDSTKQQRKPKEQAANKTASSRSVKPAGDKERPGKKFRQHVA